jgi:hypothetical protein
MHDFARLLCVTITALAVLIVSATCSAAGCMLMKPATVQSSMAAHACCHARAGSSKSHSDGNSQCPLCQNSVLINKTVEKNAVDLHAHLAIVFPAMIPWISQADLTQQIRTSDDRRLLPFEQPPTLLNLHCALLG